MLVGQEMEGVLLVEVQVICTSPREISNSERLPKNRPFRLCLITYNSVSQEESTERLPAVRKSRDVTVRLLS
jgi:hypothetical protein